MNKENTKEMLVKLAQSLGIDNSTINEWLDNGFIDSIIQESPVEV